MSEHDPSFLSDLRRALRTWTRTPGLPIASIALDAGIVVSSQLAAPTGIGAMAFNLLSIALLGVAIAWPGVERYWYRTQWLDRAVTLGSVIRAFRLYYGRYLRLVLFLMIALSPLSMLLLVLLGGTPTASAPPRSYGVFHLVLGVAGLILGVLMTFVTPALAFTTPRVRRALRDGIRMIGSEWPKCAPYVVLPPLTVSVLTLIALAVGGSSPLFPLVAALATASSLAFAGATASFYLRREASESHVELVEEDG